MKTLWTRLGSLVALTCAMALLPAYAHAQAYLLFEPSNVAGAVGSDIAMQAKLFNTGPNPFTWDSLSTSIDPSLSVSNISSSFEAGTLAGGQTLAGTIFDVTPSQAGIYNGTVTLSSGANALVSGNFQVTANSAPVPEFGSLLGLGGLLAVGGFTCFLRRKGGS